MFSIEQKASLDTLDQRIVEWLLEVGSLVIPIPNKIIMKQENNSTSLQEWLNLTGVSAVVLTGGDDIGKTPSRDNTENYILKWAQLHKKPMLGICRGMQMMGVFDSGNLLPTPGHVGTFHNLSSIESKTDWPGQTNSYHNFGFFECPPHFEVISRADDGVIEAFRHQSLPWEGWMWHPERGQFSQGDIERMRKLLRNG